MEFQLNDYQKALYAVAEEYNGPLTSLTENWATFENEFAFPARVHHTVQNIDPVYTFITDRENVYPEMEMTSMDSYEPTGKFLPVGRWVVCCPEYGELAYMMDLDTEMEAEYYAWAEMMNSFIDENGNIIKQ